MINKEEIEAMKEILSAIKPRELMDYSEFGEEEIGEVTYADYEAIQKAIEYISELESDNYEQNNIINNYIEERKEVIEKLKLFLSEIKQDGIYGYDGDIQEILSILKGETEDDE